jgi:hypothetical protein
MFEILRRPRTLRTVVSSVPSRYSIGVTSTVRPLASANDPLTSVPVSTLVKLMTKLYPGYG